MLEKIDKSHAANSGVSWDVAAECCPLLCPEPLFGARATAVWVKAAEVRLYPA